ncbi:MAG: hypothetical protein H5U38_13590 [Calditrichaeota bacterium]|nr:hypothetical protein [Calditrichota bacterium]
MPKIELRGVTERDIDLLILEELVVSPEFCDWFVTRVGLERPQVLEGVARSVVTSKGESDLEVTFYREGCRTRVLVEDKIDAALQPRQAERYSQRGRDYISRGECDQIVTLLVGPKSYVDSVSGFQRRLTYEDLVEWFSASGDQRSMYKVQLIKTAITRGENGWRMVPDAVATGFWQNYWKTASSIAPGLRMPRPGSKPATSTFIYFKPHQLRKGVKLVHKVPYGNVDLQFDGQAENVGQFVTRFQATLDAGMAIARAGKSLVVRIAVDPISLESRFADVEPSIHAALRAAQSLLQWYERHASELPPNMALNPTGADAHVG